MSSLLRQFDATLSDLEQPALSPAADEALAAPYFDWKSYLSPILAAALLAVGWPILLLTILAVRLTSRGPAIYKQLRVGRYGRTFTMYKVRTMIHNAEALTGPVWTQRRDPRINWMGARIRALHLDEFPQLINVIRGEMALVGPRPERPEFTHRLAREVPGYLDRLAVLPGITGLAQINLPPDTDLNSVRRKLILDLLYVRQGSLWLDARIILCTSIRLIGIRGLLASRLMGLARDASLPEDHDAEPHNGHGEPHAPFALSMVPANGQGAAMTAEPAFRNRPR